MHNLITILFFCCFGILASAQNEKIVGIWWNDLFTSRIEVFESNGKICGKVIWLKDDRNKDGSAPRLDIENPDQNLAKRRVLGMQILKNLTWDAEDKEWIDGEIYSPAHGKTFSCYAKEMVGDKLYLKGYVLGMPFLGSSTIWTRYK